MIRTQVYLTETERNHVAALAKSSGRSRSEIIRQAVDRLISEHRPSSRLDSLRAGRGLWAERDDLPDVTALRREVDRVVQDGS